MIKLTSWGRPKDITLRMSLWDVFRTFLQSWKNMLKLTFGELKVKMLPHWIKNNTTVLCFVIYFQIGVLRMSQVPESLERETSVTEKVVLKHWHLHMTNLFIWRKYISNWKGIKKKHLRKFSNQKLRAWIWFNDGTHRNKVDFASALDNVNNVEISDLNAFGVILLFSSIFSHLKIACGGGLHF